MAHWLEEEDIWDEHAGFYVGAVNRVVNPPGEAWTTARIYYEIGRRIAPEFWPWETLEGMFDYQLKKLAGVGTPPREAVIYTEIFKAPISLQVNWNVASGTLACGAHRSAPTWTLIPDWAALIR